MFGSFHSDTRGIPLASCNDDTTTCDASRAVPCFDRRVPLAIPPAITHYHHADRSLQTSLS